MLDFRQTRNKLLVSVAAVWLIGVVFVIALVLLNRPDIVLIQHQTNGHLMRDGLLPEMAVEFNKADHRTKSGKRIRIEVTDVPSAFQADELISRIVNGVPIDMNLKNPTVVTPSAAHWLVRVNHATGQEIVDLDDSKSIVQAMIGIVTYREMAECLGWPHKEIGYADIINLRNDQRGWEAYACSKAEWGKRPIVAFTDPTTSSTGRSIHLGLYSMAAGKAPELLTVEDVTDPDVVTYVEGFQDLVDHYLIGTTVLNTKIHQGPKYGHFFIMPEDNLIHLYEGTERHNFNGTRVTAPPITRPMVMIYPKEGAIPRNNCACIVKADWVTPEQTEAAEVWVDFIREEKQQLAFMKSGFRPAIDIPLDIPESRITGSYGLDATKPTRILNPSFTSPEVASAIDASWEDVKKPGIVAFVVDTSSSMRDGKLEQAKDGIIRALDTMAQNNQVALVSFSDGIDSRVGVGPLRQNRFQIAEVTERTRAQGNTALYDAIREAISMVDRKAGDERAIRGVVVLTDGRSNRGSFFLDDIVRMMSADEVPIREFKGDQKAAFAIDQSGNRVMKADIVGTGLAMNTKHAVQVFYVGIGADADLDVGRILAEATGADFRGVAEEDLANVLERISKYF